MARERPLTGNSTAFILRTPGTLHGQWWSPRDLHLHRRSGARHGDEISDQVARRHIFNPSNVALVLAFIVLGPTRTEPLTCGGYQ